MEDLPIGVEIILYLIGALVGLFITIGLPTMLIIFAIKGII